MGYRLLCVLVFTIALSSFAQDKQVLTLKDAVLKQGADLRPEQFRGIGWIDGENYLFVDGQKEDQRIKSLKATDGSIEDLFGLSEFQKLNQGWTTELKQLPKFTILDTDKLLFQVNGGYFVYNLKNQVLAPFQHETKDISDVHVNKGGTAIAYVKDNNVFVKRMEGDLKQVTSDGNEDLVYGKAVSRFEFGISEGLFWSPTGDQLAFYQNDQAEVTSYPLVNLDATPAELKNIKYPMAGGKSEKIRMMIYHLPTANTITLETDPLTDTYLCSITWTPDGKEVYITTLNRDQNHMKIKSFDAVTGKYLKMHYEEKDEKYVEPLYPIVFPGSTKDKFLFWSQKDGFMHVYSNTMGKIKQITKGSWVVTKNLGVDAEGNYLFLEGTGDKHTETQIYAVNLTNDRFNRITSDAGYHSASVSTSGLFVIDTYSSVDVPNRVRLLKRDGVMVKELLNAADPMKDLHVAKPEIITIERDGIRFYARIIKPHNFDEAAKYPVLVYLYNGPHAQMVQNRWWAGAPYWMSEFAERGYIVFTIDGRGSYNRGKDFEQAIFRNVSEVEMKDQLTGVKYVKLLPYVDTNRLAVHGWSYGGFMTTSLMLKHPGVFKVGVAGGPVTNWKYYEIMYTERYMDTPQTNPEGFKKTDLTNYTKNLQGKLLLIHGLSDDVVVPQHNFTLIKKFVDDGVQVDFFPYPGHPHNVHGKDRLHLMEKILDYIESNL